MLSPIPHPTNSRPSTTAHASGITGLRASRRSHARVAASMRSPASTQPGARLPRCVARNVGTQERDPGGEQRRHHHLHEVG